MKLENKDIVIIGLQPWDIEIGSNCKNIALELSKKNNVLYVNLPADRFSLLKDKNSTRVKNRKQVLKNEANQFDIIQKNLIQFTPKVVLESINWVSNQKLFDSLNKLNNKRLAKEIKMAIDLIGFKNPILFNDSLMIKGFYIQDLIDFSYSIYYIRDFLIAQPYFRKHGKRLEQQLIKKSDLVVTNSTYLRDYAFAFNKNSHYIGQGCDLSDFTKEQTTPVEMLEMKSPVIGYVGYLTSQRLDISLINAIALKRPNWNIVLVGPEDEDFKKSELHKRNNVYFLGAKPPTDLPKYINSFDVCLNPQVVNELTIGNYPRKIDEYLALGKPTVATRTDAMEVFKDHVYLANTLQEYLTAIENGLQETNKDLRKSRKEFAFSHSWHNSIKAIENAINI